MKYHFVKVQARAAPGLGRLPGQTHLLVNSLTPATPILPPSCPPASKPQLELPDVGELGLQRDISLCCPLPPLAPSSQGQMGENQHLPTKDRILLNVSKGEQASLAVSFRVMCCSNKCRSDGLPRTNSDVDPCISQETDFNSTQRKAPLKSSILQHLCQLSMDFSYLLDCFHWWDQFLQLRSSLTES